MKPAPGERMAECGLDLLDEGLDVRHIAYVELKCDCLSAFRGDQLDHGISFLGVGAVREDLVAQLQGGALPDARLALSGGPRIPGSTRPYYPTDILGR